MMHEMKQLLQKLDFQPGPIDGTLDPATVAAIESYQETAGLPIDGQPSQALLEDLRDVASETRPDQRLAPARRSPPRLTLRKRSVTPPPAPLRGRGVRRALTSPPRNRQVALERAERGRFSQRRTARGDRVARTHQLGAST